MKQEVKYLEVQFTQTINWDTTCAEYVLNSNNTLLYYLQDIITRYTTPLIQLYNVFIRLQI